MSSALLFGCFAAVVFVGAVSLPGVLVLAAGKARGWTFAAAPVVGFGVVHVSVVACAVWGLAWSGVVPAVVAAVVAAVTWGARWVGARMPGRERWRRETLPVSSACASGLGVTRRGWVLAECAVVVGVLLSGVFGAAVLLRSMGSIHNIPQAWDAPFHGAVVKFLFTERSVDQVQLGNLFLPATADTFYYPLTWHAVAALGAEVMSGDVVAVLNVSMAAVPVFAALTVAGCVRVFGGSAALALASAVLVNWAASFPFDPLWRGPLVPYTTALAVSLGVLVVVRVMLRPGGWGMVVPAGVAVAGLCSLHPAAAVATALLGVLWCVQAMVVWWVAHRGVSSGQVLRVVGAQVAVLGALLVVVIPLVLPIAVGAQQAVAHSQAVDWPATETVRSSLTKLLVGQYETRLGHPVLTGLLAGSCVVGWRVLRHWVWLLVALLGFAFLHVIAVSLDADWVQSLTSLWWNDGGRLANQFWLLAGVVAAVCVVWVAGWLVALLRSGPLWGRRPFPVQHPAHVAGVLVVLVVLWAVTLGHARETVRVASPTWQADPVVSLPDQAAYAAIAGELPAGSVVANDPNDGSPWLYGAHGVPVVFATTLGYAPTSALGQVQLGQLSAEQALVLFEFRDVASNARVQRAVLDLGVTHVVLSKPGRFGEPARAPGFVGLESSRVLERLPGRGGVELWRVDRDAVAAALGAE